MLDENVVQRGGCAARGRTLRDRDGGDAEVVDEEVSLSLAEALVQSLASCAIVVASIALYTYANGTALVVGLAVLAACALWLRAKAPALRFVGLGLLAVATILSFASKVHPLAALLLAAGFVAGIRFPRSESEQAERSDLEVTFDIAASIGTACALVRGVDAVVPDSLATLGWAMAAALMIGAGLALHLRVLRVTGLGFVVLALGRLLVFDLRGLPTDQRIFTFIGLGIFLLALSFAYTRLRDRRSDS